MTLALFLCAVAAPLDALAEARKSPLAKGDYEVMMARLQAAGKNGDWGDLKIVYDVSGGEPPGYAHKLSIYQKDRQIVIETKSGEMEDGKYVIRTYQKDPKYMGDEAKRIIALMLDTQALSPGRSEEERESDKHLIIGGALIKFAVSDGHKTLERSYLNDVPKRVAPLKEYLGGIGIETKQEWYLISTVKKCAGCMKDVKW